MLLEIDAVLPCPSDALSQYNGVKWYVTNCDSYMLLIGKRSMALKMEVVFINIQ
jgi:hypothetical protein